MAEVWIPFSNAPLRKKALEPVPFLFEKSGKNSSKTAHGLIDKLEFT